MLIKTFSIYNFLNYDYYTINFNKFSTIKDVNVLKSLYVFKYLITLSEDHPELASLVTNEIKPKPDEETIFKLEVEVNGEGEIVTDQLPKKGIQVNAGTKVTIYVQ